MSDDLVKRLVELDVYDDCDIANLVNEAADRIEKLEAALRFYADEKLYEPVWDDQFRTWVTDVISDNGWLARKALEGKDD